MKLNWGSGITIAYSVFACSMILFVVKASQQKNDLVVENYYDEAVNYQSKIDAEHNNVVLGNKLLVEYDSDENLVAISFTKAENMNNGEISFYKPDYAEKDFKVKLNLDINGRQFIPATHLAKGAWDVKVSWLINGLNCYDERKIIIQ